MSIQAMAWVLEHEHATKGATRLVLIALANHAGKNRVTGQLECWPSLRTLASEANIVKDDTVRQAIRDLERLGLLESVVKGAPDGRIPKDRRPNLYRLHLPDPPSQGGSVGEATPPPGEDGPPLPGVNDPPYEGGVTVSEPSVEPVQPLPLVADARARKGELHPAAHELAVARWEQSKVKPVCGFVALRARVADVLEAGYSPEQVRKVLPRMTVFSRNSFDFVLGQGRVVEDEEVQRQLPAGRVELPAEGDQERRAMPAGEVVL